MEITVIKRVAVTEFEEPLCEVFLGLTKQQAIERAAEVMFDWWSDNQERPGKCKDNWTIEDVYRSYVEFWKPEEVWTIETHNL